MRLRTPSCSMKAMTFCCAPAPMESMATTAATPKIMPSIVRRERSLWLARFSNPKTRSGSHCCTDLGSAMELGFMVMRRVSRGTRTDARIRASTAFAVALELFLRIDQSHDSSSRQAAKDRAALADRADLDFLHFKSAVAFAIHYFFAVVIEDCSSRNRNRVRKIVAQDAQPDRKARAQPRVRTVKLHGHIELVLRVIVPKFVARRSANGLDFSRKRFAG